MTERITDMTHYPYDLTDAIEASRQTTNFLDELRDVSSNTTDTDAAQWAWFDSMMLRLRLVEMGREVKR